MLSASLSMIGVGFTLGLMHALDADHVMAVSSLANRKPGILTTLKYCFNWALGHAGVLLISGLLLFGLGAQIPEYLQQAAEASVGVLLIGLGLLCFWQFRKQRLTLVKHSHGQITHTHWHVEGDANQKGHGNYQGKDGHAPMMVGVIHGLAGSAPALALVPAVTKGDLALSLVYLAVFSFGVLLAMMAFGLGFGKIQQHLKEKHTRLFNFNRHLIAAVSVVVGGFWVSQAI